MTEDKDQNSAESQKKKLKKSISKIEKNLTSAKKALQKKEDGVKDLKVLL